MASSDRHDFLGMLRQAQAALHCNGVELAKVLRVSPRTVYRWYAKQSSVMAPTIHDLAHLVYERDPALAQQLWTAAGTELHALRLGRLVRPLPVPRGALVDLVVCAACDALDAAPRAMRPAVLAAFRRARELGLTMDDVEKALAPATKAPAPRRGPQS
jgi:AcrR family transcriptional regulator